MSGKKSYKLFFILVLMIAGLLPISLSKKFYTIHSKPLIKQSIPIKYNAVTVNNCAEKETNIGEVFLGKALVNALKSVYKDVSMDYRLSMYPDAKNDEINIYLRGYFKFLPPFPDSKHINIAYIIYPLFYTHPNTTIRKNRDKISMEKLKYGNIAIDELQFYDVLAVASKSYAEKLRKDGFNAYYVPQFTDTKNFYYEFDDKLESDVLFVGTKREYGAADIALAHHLPITIYGPNWGSIAPKDYIDNEKLHKYYSSAKIVLNDHREDMKINGFINNRVYDVTATGTLLISDYMPEIAEIYGDSVPMYQTEEDLVSLINYYLTHEEERKEKAKQAQKITLKYFTEKHIGTLFEEIIKTEQRKKQ